MYNFEKILGNEQIIRSLKNDILNDRISHSYILDGEKKSGKQTIAKSFAKLILCEHRDNDKPCLKCSSCISFENDNNPDFFFIKSEKNKIGVEGIRNNILKNIETKPFKYKYKVFILKDANNMTIQAQNAILKTIEEPPSFAIFILLSNNYRCFLPTIISRCILFKIKPLPPKLIREYFISTNIDRVKLDFLSSYAQGSIGKAIEILSSEKLLSIRENTINNIRNLEEMNLVQMYNFIDELEEAKDDIQYILDIFLLTYRDAIIFKESNSFEKIIQKDIKNLIQKISTMSIENLIGKIDVLLKSKIYLQQNANFNMTMECLLLKLKEK